jgi:hypothetical protein
MEQAHRISFEEEKPAVLYAYMLSRRVMPNSYTVTVASQVLDLPCHAPFLS